MKTDLFQDYHHGAHSISLTQYHIIWCPKFRFCVLNDGADETLKKILHDICDSYGYIIKAIEVMPDHIHLFVDVPQSVAPVDAVRMLKSISAIKMFQAYPQLKIFYQRCGALWSRGHFISSVGKVSESVVRRYIEEQKHVR